MSAPRSHSASKRRTFVDYAVISVAAGSGGAGCVSFRREKFVPKGGPDGGDGGRGGDVIVQGDRNLHTLLDFRYRKHYQARDGGAGRKRRMAGRSGEDCVIRLPCGTLVRDKESGAVLCDLVGHGQTRVIARGGRGGQGNARFATATRQTPRFAQEGEPGETRDLILELKLLADAGLIGLPNAGKSTLLSRVSAARPKIAAYPFTTLEPHLGVVQVGEESSLVLADIPGLIRGAHQGSGLGDLFLRHIERCGVLVHLVDVSSTGPDDPVGALAIVNDELRFHHPDLARKKQVVAASKIDQAVRTEALEALRSHCAVRGLELFTVSSVTGEGLLPLTRRLWELTRMADDDA